MNNRIKSNIGNCKYFLVKPAGRKNVHETARKLIGLERIREIAITEGDYGFMIKAAPLEGDRKDPLVQKITEIAGGSSSIVVSLCHYSKG